MGFLDGYVYKIRMMIDKEKTDDNIIHDLSVELRDYIDPDSEERSYHVYLLFLSSTKQENGKYLVDNNRIIPMKFEYTDEGKARANDLFKMLIKLAKEYPQKNLLLGQEWENT